MIATCVCSLLVTSQLWGGGGGSTVKQQHDEHATQSNVLTNVTEALSDPPPVCIVRCPPFL